MLQQRQREREHRTARILYATRRKRPVALHSLRSSLIRRAVAWAFPTAYAPGGLYAFLTALLSCSVGSLKHWLSGRRSMPDRVRLILIATIATAFTVALQQAAHVLVAGLPQTIKHS